MQKGLEYVKKHTSKEIAKEIKQYFPDTKEDEIEKIVQNYKDIDAWKTDTKITKKEFNHIQEIVKNAGKLDKQAPYSKLVLK